MESRCQLLPRQLLACTGRDTPPGQQCQQGSLPVVTSVASLGLPTVSDSRESRMEQGAGELEVGRPSPPGWTLDLQSRWHERYQYDVRNAAGSWSELT